MNTLTVASIAALMFISSIEHNSSPEQLRKQAKNQARQLLLTASLLERQTNQPIDLVIACALAEARNVICKKQ